ncbi:MAG: VOC family protein [bacterium]|nr:VOC family protein [bacterium]
MLTFSSLMLGSDNPKALIAFYKKVLGKDPDWTEGEWGGFEIGSFHLTIGLHSEVKGKNKEPGRIIINLETDDVRGEAERIKNVGAVVIAKPYQPEEAKDMWIATFSDPDGNYFQLMSPMKM